MLTELHPIEIERIRTEFNKNKRVIETKERLTELKETRKCYDWNRKQFVYPEWVEKSIEFLTACLEEIKSLHYPELLNL